MDVNQTSNHNNTASCYCRMQMTVSNSSLCSGRLQHCAVASQTDPRKSKRFL
jgi:hypothetical protein